MATEEKTERVAQEVETFAEIGSAFGEPAKTFSLRRCSRLAFGLPLTLDFDIYLSNEAAVVDDHVFKAKEAFKACVGKVIYSLDHSLHGKGALCEADIILEEGPVQ